MGPGSKAALSRGGFGTIRLTRAGLFRGTAMNTFGGQDRWNAVALGAILLLGCSSSMDHGREPSTSVEQRELDRTATPEAETRGAAPGEDEGQGREPSQDSQSDDSAPPAQTTPVNLLRAVRSDVATSSVYRRRERLVAALFDGNLESAWNSRSGDLAGAWIEIRLPRDVTVSSIAMTAGFTKETATRDLFSSNHRLTSLSVSRDGTSLGTFSLDPERRDVQHLPITGPGGVLRIEIVETLQGSRSDWREVCISELQVWGHAPSPRVGERFPRFAVGALPPPRPVAGSADREAVERQHRQLTYAFRDAWTEVLEDINGRAQDSAEPDASREEVQRFRATRQRVLSRAAGLVERVDEIKADRLRSETVQPIAPHGTIAADWSRAITVLDEGMLAVADWLGTDEAGCRWGRVHLGLRLRRIQGVLAAEDMFGEQSLAEAEMVVDQGETASREEIRTLRRQGALLARLRPRIDDVVEDWQQNSRGAAKRLGRLPLDDAPIGESELGALRRALPQASVACDW